jgi:hypothetical protein
MARPTRDERKAAREAAGKRFGAYLAPLMKARGLGPTEVAERARALGGTFYKGNVSYWAAGDGAPEPHNALLLAEVLGGDPIDALHAAGHDYLIRTLIDIVKAHDAAKERGEDPTVRYRSYVQPQPTESEYEHEDDAGQGGGRAAL